MMIYKVYLKNYIDGTASLIGALPERRERIRKGSLIASALKWARLVFGGLVRDARALFIVPFDDRQKGASSTEYAFFLCLIILVLIPFLLFLGESVKGVLKMAANLFLIR